VQQALEENIDQRLDYLELRDRLDARAPEQVLRELDELGRAVCGTAWPPLPYPKSYYDESAE